ncbi:hypothetical protein LLEC1_01794 [Akanthomyces lecanii]|uniref:Uncharacterized protein n=1 Tax=Cordyceps confragosa TaxID=2714763 RepID=A0A179IGW5_CORDF|nr:hypothetical protein LLEC1_01794 [Akanthomyces lecanii]
MKELDPALYTIAWIAPLEIEAKAALHMLDHHHKGRFPTSRGDDYIYQAGDINGHNVIVATLPVGQEYGTGSAAALASQIKKFFPNLWVGLLVGVAAGVPNLARNPPVDIRLGDVLVGLAIGDSAGLIAYDLGKETADGFQLLRYGHVLASTEPEDIFYDTNDDGTEGIKTREKRAANRRTRVWYGSIGSGDKLSKNARVRNELRDKYNIIGLEMEAAGTMNRIPVGVIRGVCDYGDERKNKQWQPYAAAMAAAFAKAVLLELGPGSGAQGDIRPQLRRGMILCELPAKSERFFGRQKEISEIEASLRIPSNGLAGVVLCGISGSGKTQLALEFVTRNADKFSVTLWIDAGSRSSVEESLRTCASRLRQEMPEFRYDEGSSSPLPSVLEWLRTTPGKNWLVIIDSADDFIANNKLLTSFKAMKHGAICVISTHKAVAKFVGLKQVLIGRLDLAASQALIQWRAFEDDRNQSHDVCDALRRAAKVIDGFPLALELAGILIHEGVVPLREFAETFSSRYRRLTQHRVDPGMWLWDKGDTLFTVFEDLYKSLTGRHSNAGIFLTLCAVYGPRSIPTCLLRDITFASDDDTWNQLRTLLHDDLELNSTIDELCKVFLAKKQQTSQLHVVSISLHPSVCQWRFETLGEQKADWVIQAAFGLMVHVKSTSARQQRAKAVEHSTDAAHRLFNHFDRCLNAIWTYVDARHLEPDELLCGLATSCGRTGDLDEAEEALQSAWTMAESVYGHESDESIKINSQLKDIQEKAARERQHRKRVIIASTGRKLQSADAASNGEDNGSPIWQAARGEREEIGELLLDKGFNVETKDDQGQTALCWAARYGQDSIVQILLEKGADIEAKVRNGWTPLWLAVLAKHEVTARLLLANGADTEARDLHGRTPLFWAIITQIEAIARLLIQNGADAEAKDNYGITALLCAAGCREISLSLVVEKNGSTALLRATRDENTAIIQLLLEKGADIEGSETSMTPLHCASESGLGFTAELLLDKGADIEARNTDGQTPLWLAVSAQHDGIVQLLLNRGANTEPKCEGGTPLSMAMASEKGAMAQLLLKNGADIEAKVDGDGYTPLIPAVASADGAPIQQLLDKAAIIEAKANVNSYTPLILAAASGQDTMVRLLLDHGADMEAKDQAWGQKPLWWAANGGHTSTVKLLRERSTDMDAKNNDGETLASGADPGTAPLRNTTPRRRFWQGLRINRQKE